MINYKRPLTTIAYSTAIGAGVGFYSSHISNEALNSYEFPDPRRILEFKLFSATLLIPQVTICWFALGAVIAATDLVLQAIDLGFGHRNEEPRRVAP